MGQAPNTAAPRMGPEHRHWPRIPLWLAASVRSGLAQHNAKLLNVSRGGALIETATPLASGTHVRVDCGALQASGRVVWSSDGQAGVKFADVLCETLVCQQQSRSEAAARLRDYSSRGSRAMRAG